MTARVARYGPLWLLAAMGLFANVALLFPVPMPIGPMYWDLAVYVDADQRMRMGQVPVRDFFAPVGPLAYWLYHGTAELFRSGHPLLVAQWSLLPVTLPVMAAVVVTMLRDRRIARWQAWTLVGTFAVISLLPFNMRAHATLPGVDAFGIYNRHGALLLFVLAAVLLFARGRALPVLLAVVLAAAFLLKLTAFLAGGLLCIAALATGRVTWRQGATTAVLFAVPLVLLELLTGLVSGYLADVWVLATMNEGGLASRLLQSSSIWFGVLLPFALLTAGLAGARDWRAVVWIGAGLLCGIVYESQNTGSLGFAHMWPIAIAVLATVGSNRTVIAGALMAAALLPPLSNVVTQAARAAGGAVRHAPGGADALGAWANVVAKPDVSRRADAMRTHHAGLPEASRALAERGLLPGADTYAEADFQTMHLRIMADAVEAITALEARAGVRFDTLLSVNFVNPLPAALGRDAPRHLAIGADPFRAVPPPDADVFAAIAATHLIVRPTCPYTSANERLYELYEPAMREHRRFPLTPCAEAWSHPRFGDLGP